MIYLFGGIILFVILDSVRGYLVSKNKKKYLIQLFVLLPTIIILLFLFGPLFILSPIKLGYSVLKENNITLYYQGDRLDFAKDMMIKIRQANQDNKNFYKIVTAMPIVVVNSKIDMLRFGSYPDAGGSGSELGINLMESKATIPVITHEMSHRNLNFVIGRPLAVPNWFNEGFASYLGKMDYYKKPNDLQGDLRDGRYEKDILKMRGPLGTIQWLLKIRQGKSRVLYGQTYLMTKYLFDKFGQDKVYDFIVSLKNNNFEKAFVSSFGMTEDQFHQEFMNYIENYRGN